MARDELGAGAAGFGLVVASQGVGSLAGTVALLAYGQLPRKGLAMLAGGTIWAIGMLAIGSSQAIWQAMLAGMLMGLAPPLWMNSVQTVIITAVPAPMRARMAALFALSFQMVPAGYLLGGFLADAFGPAATPATARFAPACLPTCRRCSRVSSARSANRRRGGSASWSTR